MRTRRLCVFAAWLFLGAATSLAGPPPPYETLTLAEYDGPATDSRILSLGDGSLVVAWRDPQGRIHSRSYWNQALQPTVLHGPGIEPTFFFGPGGISLAWASGDQIIIRRFWGSWSPPITVSSGSGSTAHSPEFSFSQNTNGPDLAWIEGTHVLFSEATATGYGPPELAAADANGDPWLGLQLATTDHPNPRARVYSFNAGYELVYRERIGPGNWTPPMSWPPTHWDCCWPLRVAPQGSLYRPHQVLHVGVPRTCMCNEVYFVRETTPGGWSDPERLTVVGAAYNWPNFPGLAMAPDGSAHCFWYQSFYNQSLEFVGEGMYYRVYQDGVGWLEPWTFEDVGTWNDVSVGECVGCADMPEFCWIEKTRSGSRVVALRFAFSGSSAGGAAPVGGVTVLPNPSRGTAVIDASTRARGPVRLEIFDPAGRLVRRFGGDGGDAARFEWDGRGEDGALVPAGVYHLRVVSPGGAANAKLIRVR